MVFHATKAPIVMEIGSIHVKIGYGGEKEPRVVLSSSLFRNAKRLSLLRRKKVGGLESCRLINEPRVETDRDKDNVDACKDRWKEKKKKEEGEKERGRQRDKDADNDTGKKSDKDRVQTMNRKEKKRAEGRRGKRQVANLEVDLDWLASSTLIDGKEESELGRNILDQQTLNVMNEEKAEEKEKQNQNQNEYEKDKCQGKEKEKKKNEGAEGLSEKDRSDKSELIEETRGEKDLSNRDSSSYFDSYLDDVMNFVDVLAPCLQDVFFRSLKCDIKGRKVLIIEESSLVGDHYFREALTFILFEYLKVSALYCVPSTSIAIHAAGVENGVVVDMGYESINIMAVIDGKALTNTYTVLPERGLRYIISRLQQNISKKKKTNSEKKESDNKNETKREIQITAKECLAILSNIGLSCKSYRGVKYIPNRMSQSVKLLNSLQVKKKEVVKKVIQEASTSSSIAPSSGINSRTKKGTVKTRGRGRGNSNNNNNNNTDNGNGNSNDNSNKNGCSSRLDLDVDLSWLALDTTMEEEVETSNGTVDECQDNRQMNGEGPQSKRDRQNSTMTNNTDSTSASPSNSNANSMQVDDKSNLSSSSSSSGFTNTCVQPFSVIHDKTVFASDNASFIDTEDILDAIETLFEDIYSVDIESKSKSMSELTPDKIAPQSKKSNTNNFFESFYSYKDTNIQAAIYSCIAKCPRDYRLDLSKNLVFVGGLAETPGLIKEITKRMHEDVEAFDINRKYIYQDFCNKIKSTPIADMLRIQFRSLPLICRNGIGNWCGGSIYSTLLDVAKLNHRFLSKEEYNLECFSRHHGATEARDFRQDDKWTFGHSNKFIENKNLHDVDFHEARKIISSKFSFYDSFTLHHTNRSKHNKEDKYRSKNLTAFLPLSLDNNSRRKNFNLALKPERQRQIESEESN